MVTPDEGWITGNTVSDREGVAQDGVLYHLVQGQLVSPPQTLPNTPLGTLSMGSPAAGWAVPVADFLGEVDYAPLMQYSQGNWHLFDIPALDRDLKVGSLMPMSVQMFGPNAGWLFAVNNSQSPTGVILVRYTNGVWTQIASPPLPSTTTVFSFSAVSATDVWVVGTDYGNPGTPTTVFAHYVNGTWGLWPQTFPGGTQQFTMLSPSNGWAFDSDTGRLVLLHYDGTAWEPVSTPAAWAREGVLLTSAVFPISSTVTWFAAVTSTSYSGNESHIEMLEAYSNGQWQQVVWPDSHVKPVAIRVGSGSELWAIGDIRHQEGCGPGLVSNVEQGVLLHFDQGRWTEQVLP